MGGCCDGYNLPVNDKMDPAPQTKTVFSAGTGTRTAAEFLSLLQHYGIEQAVDVRSYPVSRFDHFRRENLEPFLIAAGISYTWMGPLLGGYRKGGYEAHMQTEDFARGIRELEALAALAPTLFFCAETVPWKCHRRYIGRALRERGWKVVHIITEKNVWNPREEDAEPHLFEPSDSQRPG